MKGRNRTGHEEYWADFFDSRAQRVGKAAECFCFSSERNRQSIYEAVLSVITDRHERALDAGAGNGDLTIMLLERVRQVVALDISPVTVQLLREKLLKFKDRTRVVKGSVLAPPFPDQEFDLIVASEVLQYAPLVPSLFRLMDLLTPGGVMVACLPFRDHPAIRLAHRRRNGFFNGIRMEEMVLLYEMQDVKCSIVPLFLRRDGAYDRGEVFVQPPISGDIAGTNRFIIRLKKK